MLENGRIPWRRPYTVNGSNACIKHSDGTEYSFLNSMLLDAPGEYWTFNQIKSARHRLRKGSTGQHIYFWKCIIKDSDIIDESTGLPRKRIFPCLKTYTVFHESCIEDLPKKADENVDTTRNSEVIKDAQTIIDEYIAREGLSLIHADAIPHYSTMQDHIVIPERFNFDSVDSYYATIFHEMVHSTGSSCRLNRETMTSYSEGQNRPKEELVAELGSARLCSQCHLNEAGKQIDNSAAYIASWIKALKDNPDWIVWASSRAEKAVNFITNNKSDEEIELDQID